MSFKSKLMEIINGLPDDDDTTDGGIREGDGPTDDASQVVDGATGAGADEGIDEDIDESGDGGDDSGDVDGTDDDDADSGLDDSSVTVEQLRASLVKLGQENERLRTRLAEMGGDAAATSSDLDADEDDAIDDEDEVEVDEDQAQADIDAQEKQIAALRGDK
jgi:hypothetical protein